MRTRSRNRVSTGIAAAAAVVLGLGAGGALAIGQSGEQKDMRRVGHVDLQGRSAYQPNTIAYPDGRTIAFVGTHGGSHPNPLNGGAVEPNGTMIVDVTDPKHPVEKFHIPGTSGNSQMVRMCLGSDLPGGVAGKVYLMRNFNQGYETWDVTDVTAPVKLQTFGGMRNTHKHWWECKSGIAYLPGSRVADGWRQGQSMVVLDWKDPSATPTYIRTYGLPGGQPGGTGDVPPSLHGPISPEDFFPGKNRLYLAYGVGDEGVMQILDRNKLLNFSGDPTNPTDAELLEAQVSRLDMSPDQGGHTSMPVFGLVPPSYQDFTEFKTRDIVVLSSESTSNQCVEAPHWAFNVDITVETQPWNLSTMWVDPRLGEKNRRGNYCRRGARFGVHSSEENFRNPFYGKLTVLAYFTGGTRVWDIREPQNPVEVAYYVPENNANTMEQCATINGERICKISYMTNNVEVDDRGYIYAADRSGSGLDIYRLTGKARRIVFAPGQQEDEED